jgi:cytochrome oxidase Cu insertion factor (SCO1/SenC/PrrC family)
MRRLALAWTLVAILSAATASALGPGDPAPDFTLNDVNGVPHTLSDYRGQVVLLALIGYG